MEKYPYIKYPELIEEYLRNETPCLDIIPIPQKPDLLRKNYLDFCVLVGLIILLFILIYSGVTNIILYGIIILILWVFSSVAMSYNQRVVKENKERLSEFEKRVNEVKSLNQERATVKLKLGKEEKLKEYCKEKIKEILKDYDYPEFVEWEEKKGISEKFFLRILFNVFGDKVRPFSKLYGGEFGQDYMPDYVIMDENLCLNIEIDEPYTLKDKLPIHCKDDDKNEKRDNFFVSNNWCVIRFAEKQILFEPYECCKFIGDIYLRLTGFKIRGYHKLKFRNHPRQIDRWDSKSANEFANNSTREQEYLKANHYASQIEYFPRNYFEDDKYALITHIGEWDENYYYCLTSDIQGINKIKLNKKLFPDFKYGGTLLIDTEQFEMKYDLITHEVPVYRNAFYDTFNTKYEEYKEKIIEINKKRTHNNGYK